MRQRSLSSSFTFYSKVNSSIAPYLFKRVSSQLKLLTLFIQPISNHYFLHCRNASGVTLTPNELFNFIASAGASQALRHSQQLPQHNCTHQNFINVLVFKTFRFRSFVGTKSVPSSSAPQWSVCEQMSYPA